MKFVLESGVWPTMITPFTQDRQIDYQGVETIIEWYISKGVTGIFSVCQSSEMFYLSLEERVSLSKFIVNHVNKRCGVIASGHISTKKNDQVEEILHIASTGVDAVVLVANRIADEQDEDIIWINNLDDILGKIPMSIPLGFYECPFPYKRILNEKELQWIANTGRFFFLKDTCCDTKMHKDRVKICKNTPLKLFNANSSTLASSIEIGYDGFSGVMGNFHPEMYQILLKKIKEKEDYSILQDFLGFSSIIENQGYPMNAKYYLSLEGLPIGIETRSKDSTTFSESNKREIEQFRNVFLHIKNLLYKE